MSEPSELLGQCEREWRPLLRAVSLVAEIDVPGDDVRIVLRALGRVYGDTDFDERTWLLTRRYPACLVVTLAGIGAIGYEHGNFWTAVWDHAAFAASQADQTLWGQGFRLALDRFDLARFSGLPLRYVGEILMHAGVPDYCLADLLNLLLRRQAQDPDLTAGDFLAWAAAPGRESRLFEVDKPVQRFIRYGGDYAEDFIDRCLELLERLQQPAFNADGLQLPARVLAKAQELARHGLLDLPVARRRSTRRGPAGERPHLELEPFGRGLLVWLPPVGDAPDGRAVWQLRVDSEPQSVASRSLWPGTLETAPATTVPLSRPVREVVVELTGSGHEFDISVVDPGDPLLVFTEDGRRVPPSATLSPEPVWLLYPAEVDGHPTELAVTGSLKELDDLPAPYGWTGWTLRRVDLREVVDLRLGEGSRRMVKGGRRPYLQLATPIPGVGTVYATPVVAQAPRLVLPTDSGVTTDWSIRIRRPGAGAALSVDRAVVNVETTIDLWQKVARPLVGPYEITVRGPLGRGLSRTVEFAEGLRVDADPPWRDLRPTGLAPTTIRATAEHPGLHVEPSSVTLGPYEPAAEIRVRGVESTETLRVTPPHMAVQRTGTGARSEWSLQPLRLDSETIGEGQLLIRLPAALPAELVVRVGGREIQTVPASASGGQPVARFELARIADTVASYGAAQLEVRLEQRCFPVARCAPRRLASAVTIDDEGRVALVEGAKAQGLVAGLYRVLAPWRPPHVVVLDADREAERLPEEIRAGGPLVALLRVEDPWLPVPWPAWPGPENAFLVPGRSWAPTGLDPDEAAVSGYLAGVSASPDSAESVRLVVGLYRHADELRRCGVGIDLREMVSRVLGTHPTALAALLQARLAASEVIAPMVHAGLAALPPVRYLSDEEELDLWALSPVAGTLASAHGLAHRELPLPLREQILTTCGPAAEQLMTGGADPYASVGRFDASAEMLARLPAEQRDSWWKAVRVVPGGLLDGDERLVAARQLFDARDRNGLRRVFGQGDALLSRLRPHLADAGGPLVAAAIQARQPRRGWQGLPALSLAFAFSARLAARGDGALTALLPQIIPHHATLARHAPHITAVDLVLAEFILAGTGVSR